MARPREFDPDTALDRALEVFAAKGYEAASLNDLLEAMEISRASLYLTFGDKHSLFLRVLDRYRELGESRTRALLEGAAAPLAALRGLFDGIAANASNGKASGCLITNTAAEMGTSDGEVRRSCEQGFLGLERSFAAALRAAAAAHEIRRRSPRELEKAARHLVASYLGLQVLARSGAPDAVLRDVICLAFDKLH